MHKLYKLIDRCKCGVDIAVNNHKNYYETVEQHFKSNPILEDYLSDIDADIYQKMKDFDTIIEIHFYPDTAVGFYKIFHYDLDMAIDEALLILKVQ